MITQLEEDELPYAYSDFFSLCEFWETSKGNKIEALSREIKYYVNY